MNARWESRLEYKNHKTEHDGSVLGTPCAMAAVCNGGRWWGDVDKVLAAAGSCVRQHEAGKAVGAKTTNRARRLGCGHTVCNGCRGQLGQVMGWCGRRISSGGVLRSTTRGGAGSRGKNHKPSATARFWARRVQQLQGGNGGRWCERHIGSGGVLRSITRRGAGSWGKNHKTEHDGSVFGAPCATAAGGQWGQVV